MSRTDEAPQAKLTRSVLLAMICALLAALITMGITGYRYFEDTRLLKAKQLELSESRAAWKKIAEEKEALQDELADVSSDLREAQLTLEESTTRAEELEEDIRKLNEEIENLKKQLPQ